MAAEVVDPAKVREFADREAFEAWLAEHHNSADELWIKIHKVASAKPSITPKEAIDVVLCWGSIDAIKKSFDETSYLQRYVPRRPKSIWSKINVENVARLVGDGRMREPGLREVEKAKADGRWDRAYGQSKDMKLPNDLLTAIAKVPAAQAMVGTLNQQNRFALAFRLHQLKTAAGREKAIARYVEMLARGETIYPQRAA